MAVVLQRQVYWPRECRKLSIYTGAVLEQGSRARRRARICDGDVPVICRRWGSSCALRQLTCQVFPLVSDAKGFWGSCVRHRSGMWRSLRELDSRRPATCTLVVRLLHGWISLVWTDTCPLKRVQNNNNKAFDPKLPSRLCVSVFSGQNPSG